MRKTIDQKSLYLFLPFKVTAVAEFISEDFKIPMHKAMEKFYMSRTYKELENERTKSWHYGPVTLYYDFLMENDMPELAATLER